MLGRSRNYLAQLLKLYNHHIPQRAIGSKTPIQALKEWQQKKPDYSSKAFMTREDLTTREEATQDIFDYIEMFYYPRRRHNFSNDLSPVDYEKRFFQRRSSV